MRHSHEVAVPLVLRDSLYHERASVTSSKGNDSDRAVGLELKA